MWKFTQIRSQILIILILTKTNSGFYVEMLVMFFLPAEATAETEKAIIRILKSLRGVRESIFPHF